jgi:hypothetical protein
MIDYKNYYEKEISYWKGRTYKCEAKNKPIYWIVFGIIVATLWGVAIEILFR